MADLLGIEEQIGSDLLGVNSQISQLTQERDKLLEESLRNPGMDMQTALGRLIAASVPALLSGGGKNLEYGANAGANALGLGFQLDKEDRHNRTALDKLRIDSYGDRIKGLQDQQGRTKTELLKLKTEPAIAGAKAEAEQPFKEAIEDKKAGSARERALIAANSRIVAGQMAGDRAADREAARSDREAKKAEEKEAKEAAKNSPEALRKAIGLPDYIGIREGSTPDKKDARILKDAVPVAATLKKDIQQLRSLLKDIGTYEVTERSDLARARSLRKGMISKLNQLQKFGALSKQELQLIGDQIPAVGDSFFSLKSSMNEMLDKLEEDANGIVMSRVNSGGFELSGSYKDMFDTVGEVNKTTERQRKVESLKQKLSGGQ